MRTVVLQGALAQGSLGLAESRVESMATTVSQREWPIFAALRRSLQRSFHFAQPGRKEELKLLLRSRLY